jgi:hypothetical protein
MPCTCTSYKCSRIVALGTNDIVKMTEYVTFTSNQTRVRR